MYSDSALWISHIVISHCVCVCIGFGLASHLGVVSSIPCVGVAKKLFHVDGLIKDSEYKQKVLVIISVYINVTIVVIWTVM